METGCMFCDVLPHVFFKFLTQTVRSRFGPTFPSLCGELLGNVDLLWQGVFGITSLVSSSGSDAWLIVLGYTTQGA